MSKIPDIPRNRFIYWIFSINITGVFVQPLLYIKLLYVHGSSYKFAAQWTNAVSQPKDKRKANSPEICIARSFCRLQAAATSA